MATRQAKKMDLLMAIEQIVEKAQNSQLSKEFYRKADIYIKYVSEKLNLTKEQSVMMALFIDNSEDGRINISEFGKYLGCRTTRILRYMNDIDVLERRELVCCSREGHSMTYRVPMEVINAFRGNEAYKPKDCSGLTCGQLFCELADIFERRDNSEMTFAAMNEKIGTLLESNRQLLFVQKVKSYQMAKSVELLLIFFSHLFVNNNDDNIGFHDLSALYGKDENWRWRHIKDMMSIGSHPLQEAKMIEFNNSDGFVNRESFRMTYQAKRELFGELHLASMEKKSIHRDVICCDKIVEKKMYYGCSVQSQVSELARLLDEPYYQKIRNRLRESGFRCGFTCLFYGAPGTGKTETALQLARQTGRDVVQLDMASIKSMWVGESEKNVKALFDGYRQKVKESGFAPILLFNEADAIIGKRFEGAEHAVDKMENTLQNIILEEMEKLEGILIATTNLVQNMDKAFERRFLYKIRFEKPNLEARMSIWHTMMPDLSESEVNILAQKYDLSGGQIENIARHYAIGNILYGSKGNTLEMLLAHCANEQLETKDTRKIGFLTPP